MRKLALALVLASLAVGSMPAFALQSKAAIVISFEKEGFGHYLGMTEDGGTIEMLITESSVTGDVQHFTATLWLSFPDERSLRAIMDGRFDGNTGEVVLNGRVVEGWLEGARVHEESQLVGVDVNPDNGDLILTFKGTVQLMPGSAD